MSAADISDYYRFALPTRSDFGLTLSGMSADADVTVLDASSNVVAAGYNGGSRDEAIRRVLEAGTYFAHVYRYSGDTQYHLALDAIAAGSPDNAGNSLAAARDAGVLSGTRTFGDFVGQADTNDYYKFTLTGRSTFNLRLEGLTADGDVELLNAGGQVIARSTNGGNNPEAISATLDAGAYFVRVYPYGSANTNYSLTLAATVVYDGTVPAPGTTEMRRWVPTDPPVRNDAAHRDPGAYDNVINQFAVAVNPRYQPTGGTTYCNIFLWDVTRAMNAEIPHWVDSQSRPVVGRQPDPNQGDRELNANATVLWLRNQGAAYGWRSVGADEAQRLANLGRPAAACWYNPGGIGHVAVVRPGSVNGNGPTIAQAGAQNFNVGHVYPSFPAGASIEYWVHD